MSDIRPESSAGSDVYTERTNPGTSSSYGSSVPVESASNWQQGRDEPSIYDQPPQPQRQQRPPYQPPQSYVSRESEPAAPSRWTPPEHSPLPSYPVAASPPPSQPRQYSQGYPQHPPLTATAPCAPGVLETVGKVIVVGLAVVAVGYGGNKLYDKFYPKTVTTVTPSTTIVATTTTTPANASTVRGIQLSNSSSSSSSPSTFQPLPQPIRAMNKTITNTAGDVDKTRITGVQELGSHVVFLVANVPAQDTPIATAPRYFSIWPEMTTPTRPSIKQAWSVQPVSISDNKGDAGKELACTIRSVGYGRFIVSVGNDDNKNDVEHIDFVSSVSNDTAIEDYGQSAVWMVEQTSDQLFRFRSAATSKYLQMDLVDNKEAATSTFTILNADDQVSILGHVIRLRAANGHMVGSEFTISAASSSIPGAAATRLDEKPAGVPVVIRIAPGQANAEDAIYVYADGRVVPRNARNSDVHIQWNMTYNRITGRASFKSAALGTYLAVNHTVGVMANNTFDTVESGWYPVLVSPEDKSIDWSGNTK